MFLTLIQVDIKRYRGISRGFRSNIVKVGTVGSFLCPLHQVTRLSQRKEEVGSIRLGNYRKLRLIPISMISLTSNFIVLSYFEFKTRYLANTRCVCT